MDVACCGVQISSRQEPKDRQEELGDYIPLGTALGNIQCSLGRGDNLQEHVLLKEGILLPISGISNIFGH